MNKTSDPSAKNPLQCVEKIGDLLAVTILLLADGRLVVPNHPAIERWCGQHNVELTVGVDVPDRGDYILEAGPGCIGTVHITGT